MFFNLNITTAIHILTLALECVCIYSVAPKTIVLCENIDIAISLLPLHLLQGQIGSRSFKFYFVNILNISLSK